MSTFCFATASPPPRRLLLASLGERDPSIAAKVEPNTAEPSPLKLHDGSGLLLKPHSRTARYCRVRKL